ncbi:hypothetical protein OROHE_017311 [Orobanche hederae]
MERTPYANELESKLDSYWQERLKGSDPLEVMAAKDKLDAAAAEALDPHVRKIRDEKYGWMYGCGAKGCTKLFHASEFVEKHLKLKHTELVMELTSKVREDLYFENYVNDEKALGGRPVMQPSFPSDIPPPVLMPVPGAGPLGPFVPATPEVAMRMFREQGGPPPFEGGRNGSYNDDLDAPDDEVTVIDYKSLKSLYTYG